MNQQNDNSMIEKIEISTDHLNDQQDREDYGMKNIWGTKRSRNSEGLENISSQEG
jgi:hypothetical protein